MTLSSMPWIRRALKIDPDSPVAHLALPLHTRDPKTAIERLRHAVAVAERALNPDLIVEDVGSFWLISETRPDMEAVKCLADTLWLDGQRREAVGHDAEPAAIPNPDDQDSHMKKGLLVNTGMLLSAEMKELISPFRRLSVFLFRSQIGFQDLEINEVLGTSGRTFVSNQFQTSNHWNREPFKIHNNFRFPRIFKLDTADPRHQVNSSRWQTDLVDGVGLLEILNGDPVFCDRGSKFIERSENPLTIISTRSDPDIEVPGCSGYTVDCHCMRADDEKLSVGIDQRTDHFEEVSVKVGSRH